ncbi:MAG: hypothetical protein AAFR61_32565, partial [Bacteroidota bacterium]
LQCAQMTPQSRHYLKFEIVEEAETPVPIVVDELRTMIDRGLIQVMQFDEEKGDYFRTAIFDSDNMHQYYYLATKDGLLKHNGF